MVDDAGFQRLLRLIASGDEPQVRGLLANEPGLVSTAAADGATRTDAQRYFLANVGHYVYAGDTALHIAAAGYRHQLAGALVDRGANVRAVNRRGATPLHYAVGGAPGSTRWDPDAQAATIDRLIEAGADPEAADKSGVCPLHVAVRSRCAPAVRALLVGGADPRRKNKSGSTPLHLAVQTTGRGGSGSGAAKEQQAAIVGLLIHHGARATDRNARGRTVAQCVRDTTLAALLR